MFCSRCGKNLGEEQTCDMCGLPIGEVEIPEGWPGQPQTGEGYAIASLVCGVVSWMTLGGCGIVPIIGIILGIRGAKTRQSGTATAGIIINAAVLVLTILFLVWVALMMWSEAPPNLEPRVRCC